MRSELRDVNPVF